MFNLSCLFYYWFFPFLSWLCPFLKSSNRFFWICLSTFLCFVLLCSDLKVVFKRIVYPVLSCVNPAWVPWVFFP